MTEQPNHHHAYKAKHAHLDKLGLDVLIKQELGEYEELLLEELEGEVDRSVHDAGAVRAY